MREHLRVGCPQDINLCLFKEHLPQISSLLPCQLLEYQCKSSLFFVLLSVIPHHDLAKIFLNVSSDNPAVVRREAVLNHMSIKLNLCDKLPVNVVLKCLDLGFPAFPVTLLVLLGVKSDAEQEQTLYGLPHVLTEPQKLVGIWGLLFGKTSSVEIERILKKQGQLLLCLYKIILGKVALH